MEAMPENTDTTETLSLTSDIVAAYVSNNSLETSGLVSLIQQVHKVLSTVGEAMEGTAEKLVPAVPIKKSIFPSHLICLEDGKKLKMLKRHLMTAYNMTPEQYRERWSLPSSYPMVAPEYAAKRSELAKNIGLGTPRSKPIGVEIIVAPKRGRKGKR
jgi:predicted transcriptional regulator